MGKSSPSPPPAPDYVGAANAQGVANVEAARTSAKLSNPNIIGPLGNQTVTYGTGDQQDIPTVTQTLTPDAQATLESQQKVQHSLADLGQQGIGTAQSVMGRAFNPDLPNMQTGIDTSGIAKMPVNAGTTAQEAIMSRLAPDIQRQEAATRQTLANQGITQGSEAYRNAMTDQGRQENDLQTQAALQGINIDMGANQQGYGQAANNAQFGNTAIANSLQQQLALRNQPLNEITALESGSQIQMPQFQGYQGQNVAPPPIFGAAQAQNQNAMQNFGIQSAGANANNAATTGLMGTAATVAMIF